MKIGILQCDDVVTVLRLKFGNYPEMIIAMLGKVEPAWTFNTYQAHNSKLPVAIDDRVIVSRG